MKKKSTVFRFPEDTEKKNLWIRKIPRQGFAPTKSSRVCIEHFSEEHIIRYNFATKDDGTVLKLLRERPKLSDDAYPSIFPNCPGYLTEEPLPKRLKTPEDRRKQLDVREEERIQEFLEADVIRDFDCFTNHFAEHSNSSWINHFNNDDQTWHFYLIREALDRPPSLESSIRVFSSLKIEVFTKNSVNVLIKEPFARVKWALNEDGFLLTWSQFESLLSHYSSTVQGLDFE